MSLTTTHTSTEAATRERLWPDPDTRQSNRTPRWRIATTSGYAVSGYLPPWAEDDPSAAGVELERLGVHLADIAHRAVFPGQALPVTGTDGPPERTEVLAGVIDCHPYGEDPGPRLPVVHLHLVDDFWVLGLDPEALSHVAEQLHLRAAWLEAELRPRLIAARDDWDRHGQRRPARAPSPFRWSVPELTPPGGACRPARHGALASVLATHRPSWPYEPQSPDRSR